MKHQHNSSISRSVKQLILTAFLFMLIGTVLELYLLEHYEDTLQLIPIICIAFALIMMVVLGIKRTLLSLKIFKVVLVLCALSGIYGTFLHLQSNFEFEQEMVPTAGEWDLFIESLSGALPVLAPLSMVALALVGYTYIIITKQNL